MGGHGIQHIKTVIQRSQEIIKEFDLKVNRDMVYTVAAFHDIGYRENPDKKYVEYLKDIQKILENKEEFVQKEMEIAKKLDYLGR